MDSCLDLASLGTQVQGSRLYPGRVQNDFSFAAHMDRQRLSTDLAIFRCCVRVRV